MTGKESGINREKNFVSCIIYIHNAQDHIESFLSMIIGVMEDNFENSEIICVNDHSDDKSTDVIKEVSGRASSTGISIVNLSYFHGLEAAMNAGMDLAIGDFVFEFDKPVMDFEPDVIMQVYRHSLTGFDIVSASSDRKQRMSSGLFYFLFDIFHHVFFFRGKNLFIVI